MSRFLEMLSGDDDDDSRGSDRSPLPYREKRELNRRKGEVNRDLELYVKKLAAANEGKRRELRGIRDVGRDADDTAREGPIQAALTARSMARYDNELETLGFNFIRDLEGS